MIATMTPERARYGSAIDLRQRLRQASRNLAGMDVLYADLCDPELCDRLRGVMEELAAIEERLGEIAAAARPVTGEMRAVTPPSGGRVSQ
jgi:hypothetical protein